MRSRLRSDSITKKFSVNAKWHGVDENQHLFNLIAHADFVITDQIAYDAHQGRSNMNFVNSLILPTGKPVVLIPDGWSTSSFGSNIVLGRAIQDAMPLLLKADNVDVISVDCQNQDTSQMSPYLMRRQVNNTFIRAETEGHFDTAEKVLHKHAQKSLADLIIVGGYGHTRMREIVLGGVTRYLSQHSTVPVLFSH